MGNAEKPFFGALPGTKTNEATAFTKHHLAGTGVVEISVTDHDHPLGAILLQIRLHLLHDSLTVSLEDLRSLTS
jgi:hypothetical protein